MRQPETIWTGNPLPLIKKHTGTKMDSPTLKARNILIKLKKNKDMQPFFIQVFARDSKVTRIFCYLNKITVEAIGEVESTYKILEKTRYILEKFSIVIGEDIEISEKKEKRHFIISTKDYGEIIGFQERTKDTALIPSAWHEYSRDIKINAIIKEIRKRHCV